MKNLKEQIFLEQSKPLNHKVASQMVETLKKNCCLKYSGSMEYEEMILTMIYNAKHRRFSIFDIPDFKIKTFEENLKIVKSLGTIHCGYGTDLIHRVLINVISENDVVILPYDIHGLNYVEMDDEDLNFTVNEYEMNFYNGFYKYYKDDLDNLTIGKSYENIFIIKPKEFSNYQIDLIYEKFTKNDMQCFIFVHN